MKLCSLLWGFVHFMIITFPRRPVDFTSKGCEHFSSIRKCSCKTITRPFGNKGSQISFSKLDIGKETEPSWVTAVLLHHQSHQLKKGDVLQPPAGSKRGLLRRSQMCIYGNLLLKIGSQLFFFLVFLKFPKWLLTGRRNRGHSGIISKNNLP